MNIINIAIGLFIIVALFVLMATIIDENQMTLNKFRKGCKTLLKRFVENKPIITITDETHTKVNKNWFDRFDGKEFVKIEVYKGGKLVSANTKQKADEIMKKHIDPDFEVKGIDSLFPESKFKRFTKPELGEPWKTHDSFQWDKSDKRNISVSSDWDLGEVDPYSDLRDGIELVKGIRPIYSEREQIIDKLYREIMEEYEVDQIVENYSENDNPVFAKVTTQFQDGQIIYLKGHKHFFNANGYEKYKKHLEVLF